MHDFGATPVDATADTPRYSVTLTAGWGDPIAPLTVPIPLDVELPGAPSGSSDPGDGPLSILDPVNAKVIGLWQAERVSGGWQASYGGLTELHGDGIEYAGSSTAVHIPHYAKVIRTSELIAGEIRHAISCGINWSTSTYRYPAQASDGTNPAGVGTPCPQGIRIQLDPSIDVYAISNITDAEITIAKALQIYGAYVTDTGGSRIGIGFEYQSDSNPGQKYIDHGLEWDYFNMSHIPWTSCRVLATWNGA